MHIWLLFPALTQNLVSQSFQIADVMSQQKVDHETQVQEQFVIFLFTSQG